MSLFRSKINPFSSFAVNLGPLYIERVFDSLLTLQGVKNVVKMEAVERFDRYLDYLKKETFFSTRDKYTFIQFYKGYFFQQLAGHSASLEHARHFREKALCAFQAYLELTTRPEESRYYAQWQSGILQDILGYPWCMVEEALLRANTIDPLRGETFKKLTDHYFREETWKTAYTHSLVAVKNYFEKDPAARRTWFVEHDAYNWKVMNTHLRICYKIGYLDEARESYLRLLEYNLHHSEEFSQIDTRHIHFLEKLFRSSTAHFASAS